MTELLTLMSDIPAGKRIFILDACHSGAAINNLDLANLTGKRDVEETKRESIRLKELDKLASRSGFAIITASGSDQKALELPQYEHGLLTYSLLSSLIKNKSVVNEQNELILEKWFIAAEEEMMKLNKNQNAEKMVPVSFNIGIINDDVRSKVNIYKVPFLFVDNVLNKQTFSDNLNIKNQLNLFLSSSSENQEQRVILADLSEAIKVNVLYEQVGSELLFNVKLMYEFEEFSFQMEIQLDFLQNGLKEMKNQILKFIFSTD
jgi:hypothetical protein